MISSLKSVARRLLRPPLHRAEIELPFAVLGSDYGGWPLLTGLTPPKPLIYSFGIGEDVSFDIAAIEQFDALVHGFDPTPRSGAWVAKQALSPRFIFHPIGIAAEDGEAEFFAPTKDVNVSFSAEPAPQSDRSLAVKAPVKRLTTIVADLGTTVPDVLKMDIEGFEYAVLDDLIAGDLRPGQLLVEFHHRMYGIANARTEMQVEKLRDAGYRLFHVSESGHEYGFVHQRLLS